MIYRKTFKADKKELSIEALNAKGDVVGVSTIGVHYQSPMYQLKKDTVIEG